MIPICRRWKLRLMIIVNHNNDLLSDDTMCALRTHNPIESSQHPTGIITIIITFHKDGEAQTGTSVRQKCTLKVCMIGHSVLFPTTSQLTAQQLLS